MRGLVFGLMEGEWRVYEHTEEIENGQKTGVTVWNGVLAERVTDVIMVSICL